MTELENKKEKHIDDDEVNLLDYWRVIRKRQKFILRVVISVVLATVIISLLMTNIYQATAVITPISAKGGGEGGMSALAQQFGGLAGIGLPGASSANEIVNLLNSNILREKIIEKYQLLPVLFYKQWDAEKNDWERGGINLNPLYYVGKFANLFQTQTPKGIKKEEGIPDVWDGLRMMEDIVNVKHNIKENDISLTVEFHDPEMAAKIADYFLSTLNDHMSSEARRVATVNRKYLEEQLDKTADPLIKQRIYNLIAQQIETAMMAEVKENFAFKVTDPPKIPDRKAKPKRAQMVIISLMMGVFIGVFGAFFMEYIEKVKSKDGGGFI